MKFYFVGDNGRAWMIHPYFLKPLQEYHDSRVTAYQIPIEDAKEVMEAQAEVQGEVLYYMYEPVRITSDPRIKCMGADWQLTAYLQSKIRQYDMFKKLEIPTPPAVVVDTREKAQELLTYFGRKIVISDEYGYGGQHSEVVSSPNQIYVKWKEDQQFLITVYMEGCHTMSVAGFVAPNTHYIYSAYDQVRDGTSAVNWSYPSKYKDEDAIRAAIMYTEKVAEVLRHMKYYGWFCCDWILRENEVMVTELNARMPGSLPFHTLSMAREFPNQPSLPELQFQSTIRGWIGKNLHMLPLYHAELSWVRGRSE